MKTSKKLNRNRSLRIESLESREMLSVNPFSSVPESDSLFYELFYEPDCFSPAFAADSVTEAAEVPEGYNAYEWNLVESQGLSDYATWEDGRLFRVTAENAGLTGNLNLSGCTNL